MTSNRHDDHDDAGSEFSLPPDLVPVSRPAQVIMSRPIHDQRMMMGEFTEPKFDPSRLLHAFRRNWLLGFVLGGIACGPLAFLTWKLIPLEYTASEFVQVSPSRASILDTNENVNRADFKSFKNTQRQLIMQPFALNEALRTAEVAELPYIQQLKDPIGWLQKYLVVTFPDDAEIMSISLRSEDPVVAHRVVLAIVKVYIDGTVEKEASERDARIDNLDKALQKADSDARAMRRDLHNKIEMLGTGDSSTLSLAQQSALQQLGVLRAELSRIDLEILKTRNELEDQSPAKAAEQNGKTEDKAAGDGEAQPQGSVANSALLAEALENDVPSIQLNKDIDRIEKLMESARKRLAPKLAEEHIKKSNYQGQLDDAKEKLAERAKRVQRLLLEKSAGTPIAENLPRKIANLEKMSAHIQGQIELIEVEAKKIGRSSNEVEAKRNEIERLEPVVSRVSKELELAKIEKQSASRIRPFKTTGIPQVGTSKKRLPLTIAAGLAGLLGPLTLLMLRDFLRNHVNHSAMINEGVSISVLGSIPRVPSRVMRRLNEPSNTNARYWKERVSESVTGVTALVLRKLAAEGHRVIMVSSATAGEGKSTLAEQLSRSLAESGHRTLLIDFDLRRPVLHQRFGMPLDTGVSEVLRQGMDLKSSVRQTDVPNLGLLSAGKCRGSLLLEAQNGTLEAFFKECRAEFEIVVVDTSPLLPVVDGRLVGQFTDGAIMTVAKDTSKIPQVITARNILSDYEISLFGCVVMGDNSESYYHSYSHNDDLNGTLSKGLMSTRSMSAM